MHQRSLGSDSLILTLRCIPMRSSSKSKSNSPSKAGSFPNVSPEVAAEIAYLMRTPGALSEGMQRPGGGGHYDPNQPRVPAGDPKGGQFASKGYRGGASDHDARVAQFAQLGPGAAHAQPLPFDQELGFMSPAQNRDAGPALSKRTRTPGEIGATTFKAMMDDIDSCRWDHTRMKKSQAGTAGLSLGRPMHTTAAPARTP
jgi:hypothetical protein